MKRDVATTRKSSFVRTLEYFRTADIEEAEACLQSATQIIVSRTTPETPRRTRTVRRYDKPNGTPPGYTKGDVFPVEQGDKQ